MKFLSHLDMKKYDRKAGTFYEQRISLADERGHATSVLYENSMQATIKNVSHKLFQIGPLLSSISIIIEVSRTQREH